MGAYALLVHPLLPRERVVTTRGGKGNEFYTPGDDHGGAWGSGENSRLSQRRVHRCREDRSFAAWNCFGVGLQQNSQLQPQERRAWQLASRSIPRSTGGGRFLPSCIRNWQHRQDLDWARPFSGCSLRARSNRIVQHSGSDGQFRGSVSCRLGLRIANHYQSAADWFRLRLGLSLNIASSARGRASGLTGTERISR